MNEKEKALVKMSEALEKLHDAFLECEEAFESDQFDCNDYIVGSKVTEDEYPFRWSFDEMLCQVSNWVNGCLFIINEELAKSLNDHALTIG